MYNTVMDVTRMYRIMMMLIAGGRATRNELAEKFEMSTRSVQRYVTALMDAGIPIVSESGKNGGYSMKRFEASYCLHEEPLAAIFLKSEHEVSSVEM